MKNPKKTPAEEFEHAERNLGETRFAVQNGYVSMGVRTLYYALFHYAKALIHDTGLYTSSHKQTGIQFRKLFVKERKVSGEVSDLFDELFDARQQADYGYFVDLTEEDMESYIRQVDAFGDITARLLGFERLDRLNKTGKYDGEV